MRRSRLVVLVASVTAGLLIVWGTLMGESAPYLTSLRGAAAPIYAATGLVENNWPTGQGPAADSSTTGVLADGEWPMAGANPQRTSWTSEEVRGQLQPLWYRPFDTFINAKTQVIAANGILYISTARGLYALSADYGDIVWVYPTELPLGHSPTVVDGVVYFGGYDRKIHALAANPDPSTLPVDGDTGYRINNQVLWTFEAGDYGEDWSAGFETNPLVVDNIVYVGNRNGYMYAINASDGTFVWNYKTNGPILFSAAYEDNTIYFASNDSHAYALDVNGNLVWKSAKLPGAGFHSYWPVVYQDWVIFSGGSHYSQDKYIGTGLKFDKYESIDVYQGLADGDLVGPIGQEPGPWVTGTVTLDGSRITEYFEEPLPAEGVSDPAGLNRSNHKPWRRTYFVLNRFTGQEYTFDSDNDGYVEYAPILWVGTGSGNRYPPALGADGVLYQENSYRNAVIDWGNIVGWKFGTQHMSLVSSYWSPVDEPNAYAIGGNMLYYASWWSSVGGAIDISTPDSTFPNRSGGREYFYYNYDIGGLLPGGISFERNYQTVNPPIPYQGKLYTNNSGTIVAWASTANDPAQSPLPVAETIVAQEIHPPFSTFELRQRLAVEVEKILNAGHLRPGYHRTGIADYVINEPGSERTSYLSHYWHNPGETYYTLIRALPHLSTQLQQQVRNYLQQEFADFPPTNAVHIGWEDGAAREIFDTPPEIAINMSNFPVQNWIYKSNMDSQYRLYGIWKYAQELGNAPAIFSQVRNKVVPPPGDSVLLDHPYVHNAYIAGYIGYLELGKLAGYDENDLLFPNSQTTIRSELDRLMQLRADNLSIDSPYQDNWKEYLNVLHVARNFMYLVPELADFLHTHAFDQALDIVDQVNDVSPYWFVSKYDATFREGTLHVLFDYHSIFQAKALILRQSREELSKYLDVPAFERGDLFYVQNLIAAIEAPQPLEKSANPTRGDWGTTITYTLSFWSTGNTLALTDALPSGVSAPTSFMLEGSTVSPTYHSDQHRLTWSDTPSAGLKVTIGYTALVTTSDSQSLVNLAELSEAGEETRTATTIVIANPHLAYLPLILKEG